MFAVIGDPIAHSLSPVIHHTFAQQHSMPLSYTSYQISMEQLPEFIRSWQQRGGIGLNVTHPLKKRALTLCHTQSSLAQQANAASTITFSASNKHFHADNFDGPGLASDISKRLQFDLKNKNILIIGAGGAAHAILPALIESKPNKICIVNKTPSHAHALAKQYQNSQIPCTIIASDQPHHSFDLIINATTAGFDNAVPQFHTSVINSKSFCYDLCYGTAAKPFLALARRCGAADIADGLGMLIEHHVLAFWHWHHLTVDSDPVYDLLRAKYPLNTM